MQLQVRLRHLMLEDFMEAIVRLAMVIALQTDAELELVPGIDAGEFIMMLRGGKDDYAEFIEAHRREQGHGNQEQVEPRQHVSRCVDHFMSLVTRLVELNTRGKKDELVDEDEALAFLKKQKDGKAL